MRFPSNIIGFVLCFKYAECTIQMENAVKRHNVPPSHAMGENQIIATRTILTNNDGL